MFQHKFQEQKIRLYGRKYFLDPKRAHEKIKPGEHLHIFSESGTSGNCANVFIENKRNPQESHTQIITRDHSCRD